MKDLRMRRLFGENGRTVIIAFDHAAFMGPMRGLEDPGSLLDSIRNTGINAVLTTQGIARSFATRFGSLGLLLRADGGSSMRNPQMGDIHRIVSVEDAVRLGADAVVCMGMIGFPEETSSLLNLTELVSQAAVWNMPVMAEMLVKASENKEPTAEDIGFAMRVGVELGADIIKTPFAGPMEQYRKQMAACYRPVVVLGGAKVDDESGLLTSVAKALEAGASGVAIGRNVWQHGNPTGMCRALVALVHGGASVAQALTEIK
ncbi:MAG: hypothetical protein JW908_16345 [Anaerolineales bacterium]|nr:hypothetical protein [Anaerolineales bacterium]